MQGASFTFSHLIASAINADVDFRVDNMGTLCVMAAWAKIGTGDKTIMESVRLTRLIEKMKLENLTPETDVKEIRITQPDVNRPASVSTLYHIPNAL